jgi:DnaJ-class molecular chaperone
MNYYEVLNVDKNSAQDEIKKAYRKLSLQFHPDKPTGDAEKFKNINEAYQTLGDPEKKQMYDMGGVRRQFSSGPNGFPEGGMDDIFKMFFNGQGGPGGGIFGGMGAPEDFFNPNMRVFHNGRPVNMRMMSKPAPIIKTQCITFRQSFNGYQLPINIERWIMMGGIKKLEKEKIYVTIPKGIDDGEMLILREKGNIIDNERRGDIKIFIKISNDTEFKRHGLDLLLTKNLSLKESLIGFKFDIKYLNGQELGINNNGGTIINPGFEKIIPDLGFERDDQKGNLIIKFNVKFPESLTLEQINKLKDIL